MQDFPDIAKPMKNNILINYICKIRAKVNLAKHKMLSQYMQRADHQNLLIVEPKQRAEMARIARANLFEFEEQVENQNENAQLLTIMQNEFDIGHDAISKSLSQMLDSVDAKDREILRLAEENKRLRGIMGVVNEEVTENGVSQQELEDESYE